MPSQLNKPKPLSLSSSPARPTSLYVTPPLELSDDEEGEDYHNVEQLLSRALTPLSSVKSTDTFKQQEQQQQSQILQQQITTKLPSLTISTPPVTPKEDDLGFFKPPPKRSPSGTNLQLDGDRTTSEPSSPSSSTSKRILTSPARFMKRLSQRLRSGSELDLAKRPATNAANTSVTPLSPISNKFEPRSVSFEKCPTTPGEEEEEEENQSVNLKSTNSVRVRISRPQTLHSPLTTPLRNETKICNVSELGSPQPPQGLELFKSILMESPLAQLSHSSLTSSVNTSDATKVNLQQSPSTDLGEQVELPRIDDDFSGFFDSTFASNDSMISIDNAYNFADKHMSIEGESDIFRTPPQYRGSKTSDLRALDEILPSTLKRERPSLCVQTTSPIQSRISQASCSPVEPSPFLRLNIFLEDSQSTPPLATINATAPGSRGSGSPVEPSPSSTSSSASDHHDFIAIKLRKDKLQDINELVNVIMFKIMSKKPNIRANDIYLSIFFKDLHLKPILLREPRRKKRCQSSSKEMLIDDGGLLLDYVQLKRKLYIRAQF